MSNPNDPRYPSTGPGPHPRQAEPWQQQYPSAGQYPQQPPPYAPYAQPYPGQQQYHPGQQPYPGYQPYPQHGPTRTFSTSAGAVIGLGALGGALAYLFVAIPATAMFDTLAFGSSLTAIWRGLTLPIAKLGIPNALFAIILSIVFGALAATMRLGIRNAALMILAGLVFGLLVRTGISFGVIGPLIGGTVRLDFPVLTWARILLSNGLWGLGTAAFLVMTTRR